MLLLLNESNFSYSEHGARRASAARRSPPLQFGENEAVVRVARGQFCFIGALRIGGGTRPTSANWKWCDGKPFNIQPRATSRTTTWATRIG